MDVELDQNGFHREWDRMCAQLAQVVDAQSSLDLPQEGLGAIYEKAHDAFKAENYGLAENLFILLRTMEPGEIRFQIGLAAALESQEKYGAALTHYAMAMGCGKFSPDLLFRAGKCLLGLESREEARCVFAMATTAEHEGTRNEVIAVEKAKKWLLLLSD